MGSPAKMEYKQFEITIIDIDDNNPRFLETSYTFKVIEGQGVGYPIGAVEAVDPDEGSCVTYSASEKDIMEAIFKVDPNTGMISTLKDFDFETEQQKEFYLEIYAAACDKPSKLDLVRANIQIIDINDNR